MSKQTAAAAAEEGFRPEPGELFQVLRGYQYDEDVFRVIEYAPINKPDLAQRLYQLSEAPTEAVHCWLVEKDRHDGGLAGFGSSFHAFPTTIMAAVGSTRPRPEGLASRPRRARQGRAASGRCEHCGEPTKGGRFVAGHDAKLKSILHASSDLADIAEAQIRAALHKPERPELSKWWHYPPQGQSVDEMVAQGEGFLRSRVAARIGEDPGRREEIA